jgi:hypothetical protein
MLARHHSRPLAGSQRAPAAALMRMAAGGQRAATPAARQAAPAGPRAPRPQASGWRLGRRGPRACNVALAAPLARSHGRRRAIPATPRPPLPRRRSATAGPPRRAPRAPPRRPPRSGQSSLSTRCRACRRARAPSWWVAGGLAGATVAQAAWQAAGSPGQGKGRRPPAERGAAHAAAARRRGTPPLLAAAPQVWFKHDLRVTDHPGLLAAVATGRCGGCCEAPAARTALPAQLQRRPAPPTLRPPQRPHPHPGPSSPCSALTRRPTLTWRCSPTARAVRGSGRCYLRGEMGLTCAAEPARTGNQQQRLAPSDLAPSPTPNRSAGGRPRVAARVAARAGQRPGRAVGADRRRGRRVRGGRGRGHGGDGARGGGAVRGGREGAWARSVSPGARRCACPQAAVTPTAPDPGMAPLLTPARSPPPGGSSPSRA